MITACERRNPEEVLARRYAWRWERVEREAAAIEAGEPLPTHKDMHLAWDEMIRRRKERDPRTELEKRNERQRRYRAKLKCKPVTTIVSHEPISERELCGASSIADRIRVMTAEELARL